MSSSNNGQILYEAGQTLVGSEELSDSGDHLTFNSISPLVSGNGSFAPVVSPNGVLSGGLTIPAVSLTNDLIDTQEVTVNLNGVAASVIAADTDVTCTRGAGAGTANLINSITVNAAGSIAVVAGTGSTAFSATRGAAGGPPLIPVDSIEIAQVRFTSEIAAAVLASEIFDVPGTHRELANSPNPTVQYFRETNGSLGLAGVDFVSALPLIHTGGVAKKVFMEYYTPLFAEVINARNFVPPLDSASVTSEQWYQTTTGSVSTSLGQGSFEFAPQDGITDDILTKEQNFIFWKFLQDKLKTPYYICQGYFNQTPTFPADVTNTIAATISAEATAVRITA